MSPIANTSERPCCTLRAQEPISSSFVRCQEKGMRLEQDGLHKGRSILAANEQGIYRTLGLPFIDPELREGHARQTDLASPPCSISEPRRMETSAQVPIPDSSGRRRQPSVGSLGGKGPQAAVPGLRTILKIRAAARWECRGIIQARTHL